MATPVLAPALTALRQDQCRSDAAALTVSAIEQLLALVPDWQHEPEAKALRRELRFKNYYHVMSMVNAIAWIANKQGHHPDLEVSYSRVLVRFSTHDVGGLSRNDFICAAKTDALLDVGDVGPVLA